MDKPFALIIEDERDIAALFRHVLDVAGYRTEIILHGKEALKRLEFDPTRRHPARLKPAWRTRSENPGVDSRRQAADDGARGGSYGIFTGCR